MKQYETDHFAILDSILDTDALSRITHRESGVPIDSLFLETPSPEQLAELARAVTR